MRILVFLVVIALAGCTTPTGPATIETTDTTSSAPVTTAPDPSPTQAPETKTPAPKSIEHVASFEANRTEGEAPLQVDFALDASDAANVTSWTLSAAGMDDVTGDALPADASMVFEAGEHEVTFVVDYADGTSVEADPVTIQAASPPAPVDLSYHQEISGELPVVYPGGFGLGDPAPGHCDGAIAAEENDLNGTFVAIYKVEVFEGASLLHFEGGAPTEQQDPVLGASYPDFDLVYTDPAGACDVKGSDGGYETIDIEAPAAGTWTLAVLNWATPNGAYTGVIDVLY